MSDTAECLVAREVPHEVLTSRTSSDSQCLLTEKLQQLLIAENDVIEKKKDEKKKEGQKKEDKEDEKKERTNKNISPADFVALQSIRSSALARKTNTTSKFGRGGQTLFADIIDRTDKLDLSDKKEDDKVDAKKERKEKGDDSESDDDLISRGPVRTTRTPVTHHPYAGHGHARDVSYGTAAQSTVEDFSSYSAYGMGYECGAGSWQDSPDNTSYISASSTPDTVQSDNGYASSISPSNSPFADNSMSSADLNRLLSTNAEQLPDPLVDFILSYSRSYGQVKKEEPGDSPLARPPSADSACADSPLSAGSAPHCSPGQPHAGFTGRVSPPGTTPRTSAQLQERPARFRLRATIPQESLDIALIWVCKLMQNFLGALTTQDPDQDSFLHIVMQHCDVARVYALVEQQLKLDYPPDRKPFDLKNRYHETPLLIAVERRNLLVVEYLLEAGANPNTQPLRGARDAPLHYAATRGLVDIVKVLIADPRTQLDLKNGLGLTALHCAVRHDGVFDETTQSAISNSEVIRLLIEAGADPAQVSSSDGKTLIHYATEKCDISIIELIRRCVKEEVMTDLVNRADFNHEVPLDVLQIYKGKIDEHLHSELFYALLTCGASCGK